MHALPLALFAAIKKLSEAYSRVWFTLRGWLVAHVHTGVTPRLDSAGILRVRTRAASGLRVGVETIQLIECLRRVVRGLCSAIGAVCQLCRHF